MSIVSNILGILEPLGILFGLFMHLDSFVSECVIRIFILDVPQSLPILQLQREPLKGLRTNLSSIFRTPKGL